MTGKAFDGPIISANGLTLAGGRDEKGTFVLCGPTIKSILIIMWKGPESKDWTPWKMYPQISSKTRKRATKLIRQLRVQYMGSGIRFKLDDDCWASVPVTEMEKIYYETEDEVFTTLENRYGDRVGRDELRLGLFRGERGEPVEGSAGPGQQTDAGDHAEIQHSGPKPE